MVPHKQTPAVHVERAGFDDGYTRATILPGTQSRDATIRLPRKSNVHRHLGRLGPSYTGLRHILD